MDNTSSRRGRTPTVTRIKPPPKPKGLARSADGRTVSGKGAQSDTARSRRQRQVGYEAACALIAQAMRELSLPHHYRGRGVKPSRFAEALQKMLAAPGTGVEELSLRGRRARMDSPPRAAFRLTDGAVCTIYDFGADITGQPSA